MFADCFLESASSPPCKRAAAHFVSGFTGCHGWLGGEVPGTYDKVLAAASLRESHPQGLPWKEGWLQGSSQTLLIPSEKYFRVGSLSSHPFCRLEVIMASVRTSFPDRKETAKAAASGFTKPWPEKRYNRLRASQTLSQATQESLISMVKKVI